MRDKVGEIQTLLAPAPCQGTARAVLDASVSPATPAARLLRMQLQGTAARKGALELK